MFLRELYPRAKKQKKTISNESDGRAIEIVTPSPLARNLADALTIQQWDLLLPSTNLDTPYVYVFSDHDSLYVYVFSDRRRSRQVVLHINHHIKS